MHEKEILRALQDVEGISELDYLLLARERARATWLWLRDAYRLTGNPVFLDYRDRVGVAGELINEDLQAWIDKTIQSHGSSRFAGLPGEELGGEEK